MILKKDSYICRFIFRSVGIDKGITRYIGYYEMMKFASVTMPSNEYAHIIICFEI